MPIDASTTPTTPRGSDSGAAHDDSANVGRYLSMVVAHLQRMYDESLPSIGAAAGLLADHVAADRIVHVYGPGGHSNLGAQEIFNRAGGLMHISAILDLGTMLSSGGQYSKKIERLPGYGRIVMEEYGIGEGDLLILVNAYGINAALIDAALMARDVGARTIGVSSFEHAEQSSPDHPARHPSKLNLHQVVDVAVDSKVPICDAILSIDGVPEKVGPISTFANAFALNAIVIEAISVLASRGISPPVFRSGNAPGGDEVNAAFRSRFRGRIKHL
jgi:uncharacterized phosphosugar-binding protein